jgi:predicted ribosome quality control (RQC) complex YloA/Tae2 family protein
MLRNYFTLYHVARELHERLAGGYLFEIHSQEKNEITLSFVTLDGTHLQLTMTVRSPDFSISTREGLNRKRRNSVGIMSQVDERQVTEVTMAPGDREIRFLLDDGHFIVLRFYSAGTNVLLVRDGRIVEAFKESRELEGHSFDEDAAKPPVFRSIEAIAGNEALFCSLLETSDEQEPLERRLSSFLPGFDRGLSRQLILRAGGDLSSQALFRAFSGLFYELASPSPSVIQYPGQPPVFSILEAPEASPRTAFEQIIEALNHYTRCMHRFRHMHASASARRSELSRRIGKLEKELDRPVDNNSEEMAMRFETYGHLLTAAIGKADPSSGEVTVPDIFTEGNPEVKITVKPQLNMQQNAAWHFLQASKARKRVQSIATRHAMLREELQSNREELQKLDAAETPEAVGELLERKAAGGRRQSTRMPQPEERHAGKFRTVPLSPTITLFVGKNAANNELLTFDNARPDDIWLHARGASGSHCILKGAGMHNMTEIRRAAEIAAWYSSARNSGLVPVIYTFRKYVRRSGKAPGSVIVEREKVVMARPLKE